MGKIYFLISVILLAFNVAFSQSIGYEWWLDNDVSSLQTEVFSGNDASFQIDTSGLTSGLHSFNCRIYSDEGEQGSIYQKLFYIAEEIDTSLSFEYWIDDNVAGKKSGNVESGSQIFDINLPELSAGVHYFNYRLNRGGEWGSIYSKMLFKAPYVYGVEGYEYWLDDDYANKKEGKLAEGGHEILMDINGLDYGIHRFCYRLNREDGVYGSVFSKYFFIPYPELEQFQRFEYWLDDDYANRKEKLAEGNPDSWEIDLSGFDMKKAKHWLNLRVLDEKGAWGAVYRKCINNQIEEPGKTVIGYRHYLNDINLGYVEMEPQLSDSYLFDVDVPESAYPSIRHVLPTFEGNQVSVSVSDSVRYVMQLQTESCWTPPTEWNLEISKSFSTTAIDMAINSKHTFIAPKVQEFYAVRFTATGDSLYFKTDMPISLDIYKDGVKYAEISEEDLNAMCSLQLEEGEYYGLLYGYADTPAENVTLQIMDAYKASTPYGDFDAETRLLTLNCATDGASLFYTFDLESDWNPYVEPIDITRNCIVYAKASRDGLVDSEVATIRIIELADNVPVPEIIFEDGMVEIICANKDAEIHYTVDDENLTEESPLYAGPFALDHNATIRAFAFVSGLDIEPSDVFVLVVDSYQTATPTANFNHESRSLTLQCNTEGATISYSFNPDVGWTIYSNPIIIEENCTVYVKAVANGYNESEILVFEVGQFKCSPVQISYDGRNVSMTTDDKEAIIKYSIVLPDGIMATENATYTGEIDVKTLCNVTAIAEREGYQNSDAASLDIDFYADEYHAETSAAGQLESAFKWNGFAMPENVEDFKVEGYLNDADYRFLNSHKNLRHLDIESVRNARIPDRAFLNTELISISLPADLVEYGDSILTGASRLSSVIWNSQTQTVDARLADGLVNPNVLLYVPSVASVSASGDFNIVANGNASSVTLHYGFPYYAARDFHADAVSMKRDFKQTTEVGVCRGWETIVLPFKPESIAHAVNGPIVPFAAWDGNTEGMKPFWLYSSSDVAEGWKPASEIVPCVPYIISMPNNPDYIPSANLGGSVKFSATNVNFKSDSNQPLSTPWVDNSEFVGTFMPVEEVGLLSLNVNDTESGLEPGSTFVPEGITVPFGAYVRRPAGPKAMPLFGSGNGVYLPSVTGDGLSIETPAPGMLKISSGRELHTAIFTPEGATVKTIDVRAGETLTIEGLTRGLYIVAGVKVMVR